MSNANDDLMVARRGNILDKYLPVCESVPKYLVLIAFLLAVYVSLAQFSASSSLSGSAFEAGYLVFPFLIFSIFLAVYGYSWPLIRRAWRRRSWKWFSLATGIGYVLFYVFATNTVSVPDSGIPIPANLARGYIVFLEVYGPMTVWPDVELYFPSLNLVGYFSVGNVLLFIGLAFLTACAVTLLMQSASVRRQASGGAVSFGGAFLAALSTNACCCCTPVILPVLVIFFGGTLPSVIADSFVNPQSPLSNLLVLATLASLVASVTLSVRRCRSEPNLEAEKPTR
ncbi:MAG: hypothetical protein ACLP5V_02785 [Candidatus Bathyarchaeia archaeon]